MNTYPLTVLYEEACPLCKLEMDNLKSRNVKGLLRFVDISAADFDPAPYGISLADMMALIHAVKADGEVVKGVEVFRLAYGAVGLGWLTAPTGWPVLSAGFDRVYAWFACNRHGLSGKSAWLLEAIAARRTAQRVCACKAGNCTL